MKIKEIIYKNHAVSLEEPKRYFNAEVLQLKAGKARGLQTNITSNNIQYNL